jgi:lysophospholipase L1-like esterase
MPLIPSGTLRDSANVYAGNHSEDLKMIVDTIRLDQLTDRLSLQSTRRKPGTDSLLPDASFRNLFFGFNLTNGNPGILYHTVGINGAMFVNFTDPLFVRQIASFHPSLLILSLGTNESFGRRFNIEEFSGQIESFLALVKKYMPHTAILLTTPPECYKRITVNKQRQYIRNDNSARVAQAINEVAGKEGIACWDLFRATGGKDSSKSWYNGHWMGRDHIHFTKNAYYEQGKLLYKALMNRKTETQ